MKPFALCVLLALACGGGQRSTPGGGSTGPSAEPDDGGPICASMAAKFYAPSMARVRGTRQQNLFELQRDAMIESCRVNAWSAAARACFAERSIDDNTCQDRLTPEQHEDWRERSAAALRAAGTP